MSTRLAGAPVASLRHALGGLPETRARRGRRFALPAVLTFAFCGMMDGARSLYAIDRWGRRAAPPALVAELGMTSATPSVATLFRGFGEVDRPALEAALLRWVGDQGMPASALAGADAPGLRGLHGELLPGVRVAVSYGNWLDRA